MDKEQADVLWADVELRRRKNNQILFRRDSLCLQPLLEAIGEQDHRTVAAWALDCAWEPCRQLEERYEDSRPRQAIETCWAWARGQVKMRQAQQAILAAHAMAKEVPSPADAALCHAVGQACGAVHVETHAIGLPMYELTAIVRRAAGRSGKGRSEEDRLVPGPAGGAAAKNSRRPRALGHLFAESAAQQGRAAGRSQKAGQLTTG